MKKLRLLILIIVFMLFGLIITNYMVSYQARNYIYDSVDTIPKNKVGLLLGVNKFAYNGHVNLYYKHRLNAAVTLFESGKVEFILVSGDNGSNGYDEPTAFKVDLIARGVPEDKIVLDYAGFRTLDSVIRAKEIFGQDSITIISQQFHNERAIYLAKHKDMNPIAFNANDVDGRYGLKVELREYLARAKASIDLLFNVGPKFLGEKIEIK